MKTKIFSFILPLFIVIFFQAKKNSEQGIIRLMYTGDYSKPYPVVILRLPGTLDTVDIDTWKLEFEIAEIGFEQIKKATEEKKIYTDSVLSSPYRIEIYTNGETSIFLTPYLRRIRTIFYTIVNQLNDIERKEALSEFNSILTRLKFDNKLK